jgi:hypothetical protein
MVAARQFTEPGWHSKAIPIVPYLEFRHLIAHAKIQMNQVRARMFDGVSQCLLRDSEKTYR